MASLYDKQIANITATTPNLTMGPPNGLAWVGPAPVQFTAAARPQLSINSGAAPRVAGAVATDQPIVGTFAPARDVPLRAPTSAGAGGHPHFWPGAGRTRVVGDNFIIANPAAHEWVLPGSTPAPSGSMVMRWVEGSGWVPVRGVK